MSVSNKLTVGLREQQSWAGEYFKTLKIQRLKWRVGVNDYQTERPLSDYQAHFHSAVGT